MAGQVPNFEFSVVDLDNIDYAAQLWDMTEHSEEERSALRPEDPVVLQSPFIYDTLYHYAEIGHPVAQSYMQVDQVS